MVDDEDELYHRTSTNRAMFVLHCSESHRGRVLLESSEQLRHASERYSMRLASCNNATSPIDVVSQQTSLRTNAFGRVVLRAIDAVPSTQDMLRGAPLRAPFYPDVVAIAQGQTNGHGRAGSAWITTNSALAFSVECRVPAMLAPFAQYIAALAVADAVLTSLKVKWPNDVLTPDRRKVAGVLCEGALRGNEAAIVIGIGVNLVEAAFGGAAISELDTGMNTDPTQVLANTLNKLEPLYNTSQLMELITTLQTDITPNGSIITSR